MACVRSKLPTGAVDTAATSVILGETKPLLLIGRCTEEACTGASSVVVATANEDALGIIIDGDLSIITEESVASKGRSEMTDVPSLSPFASGLAWCGVP